MKNAKRVYIISLDGTVVDTRDTYQSALQSYREYKRGVQVLANDENTHDVEIAQILELTIGTEKILVPQTKNVLFTWRTIK